MKFSLLILILSITLFACTNEKGQASIIPEKITEIDAQPGQCPYLTKDAAGATVLSWVRTPNDSSTAFCYAISKDGQTFSTPVVIPNSGNIEPHGENLPKIIFKPSGEIIALWGAANPNPRNKYSGLVFYVQSFDKGKSWTTPKPLINDTASFDQRYYDVALLPNGEAGIIWLDNRKTLKKEGSGLYFASTHGKNGFEEGRLISQPCCQCCRTDLFVDRKGGVHAIYRAIIQDSIRDMVHIISTDGGQTFSSPQRISMDNWVIRGCPHTGPSMTENKEGIHFAWFTGGNEGGCFYTKSTDNGKTFVMHDSVSTLGSHPQLAALNNGALVIVWDESTVVADKVFRKIGMQKRNEDGKADEKTYLTPEDTDATFPVVAPLQGASSIVAYTIKKNDKPFIAYQVVDLN